MNDTPPEIQQKQLEIIMSKTMQERFLIGLSLIDFAFASAEAGIRHQNPNISEADLKIAIVKRFYSDCFSEEEMERIAEHMRRYYEKKGEK